MKKKGCLITFEGGDGAGKSTLIDTLHLYLEKMGRSAIKTRAPGGTKMGDVVRSLLLHHTEMELSIRAELFLFLADRAQHVEEIIVPAIDLGKIVLCDRYNDSTTAYQGVARGFDPLFIRSLCDFATNHLEPDLTLYLDIDPKIGLLRAQAASSHKDRIESESLLFHEKIRSAFHAIAKDNPARFRLIDATKSAADVFEEALDIIHATIL